MMTGMPTVTISKSFSTSGTYMRMQPCEMCEPIEDG